MSDTYRRHRATKQGILQLYQPRATSNGFTKSPPVQGMTVECCGGMHGGPSFCYVELGGLLYSAGQLH